MCPRSLDHCPGSYYLGYDVRVPNFRKLPFKLCHVTTHDDRTATRTTWTKTTRTGRPLRDNQKTSEKPAGDDQETTRRPPGNQQETTKRPPGYQLETQETSGDHQETSRTAPGNHQDTSKLLSPSTGGIQTHSGAQRQLLARFGNTTSGSTLSLQDPGHLESFSASTAAVDFSEDDALHRTTARAFAGPV